MHGGIASDRGDWVTSDYAINWGSSTFALTGEMALSERTTFVYDGFPYDQLTNELEYGSGDLYSDGVTQIARLPLTSYDTSWLSDSSFPANLGLAPDGANVINFADDSWVLNPVTSYNNLSGAWGEINLTSLRMRAPASVPEPGTVALMCAGLMMLGFAGRSRRTRNHQQEEPGDSLFA